ncbi:hypothetical protein JOM56_001699 [Amanita muscaria]
MLRLTQLFHNLSCCRALWLLLLLSFSLLRRRTGILPRHRRPLLSNHRLGCCCSFCAYLTCRSAAEGIWSTIEPAYRTVRLPVNIGPGGAG